MKKIMNRWKSNKKSEIMANEDVKLKEENAEKIEQILPCENEIKVAARVRRKVRFKAGASLATSVNMISADVEDNSTEEFVDFKVCLVIK